MQRQKVAERAENSVQFINMNLMFYQGLARINQHIEFDLEYLFQPTEYASQWKQIITLVLDFLNFKDKYAPKHLLLQENLK